MQRMLIAGGGYADIPLIQSAKKRGYYVITTGNRPDDLGHFYSDEFHAVDFSDCEAIYKLARNLNVSAICPCCNDFSALSAAYAAEKLKLPGHDPYQTAIIIHHKDKYRRFARAHDIPTPKAVGGGSTKEVLSGIESLSFPVIIKPVDLSGGKGITVVNTKTEIPPAITKALNISKAKRVVVEEFITGTRHGFSTFIRDKKVGFYFSDNEHYYLNPYMVSAASTPAFVPEAVENKLCLELERIASRLSLKDGILHVQYILKDGMPYIIEICRRAPGDLYINLVEHSTGADYPGWIVRAFAGKGCGDIKHLDTTGFYVRHCVMGAKRGIIHDVVFDDSIKKNIIDKFMWWKKGDVVEDFMTAKFGIVFLKFDTAEEMKSKADILNELIVPRIE